MGGGGGGGGGCPPFVISLGGNHEEATCQIYLKERNLAISLTIILTINPTLFDNCEHSD